LSAITTVRDGVGESVRRPDGIPKVKGEFAYSSSSTPAVVAALRAATGRPLTRVPVRPDDMVGL